MPYQETVQLFRQWGEQFIEQSKLFVPTLGTLSFLGLRDLASANAFMEFTTNCMALIAAALSIVYYIICIQQKRKQP